MRIHEQSLYFQAQESHPLNGILMRYIPVLEKGGDVETAQLLHGYWERSGDVGMAVLISGMHKVLHPEQYVGGVLNEELVVGSLSRARERNLEYPKGDINDLARIVCGDEFELVDASEPLRPAFEWAQANLAHGTATTEAIIAECDFREESILADGVHAGEWLTQLTVSNR